MKHITFGTDGLRGNADAFPFTDEALIRVGYAIGCWAQAVHGPDPRILIAKDTRLSGPRIYKQISAGIRYAGTIAIDAGILPTTGVLYLIRHYNIPVGLMISASHNPPHDNGIKFFDQQGKLDSSSERDIATFFTTHENPKPLHNMPDDMIMPQITPEALAKTYIDGLYGYFDSVNFSNAKVVLDCAYGAAHNVATKLFHTLGINVIALHDQPNGARINDDCGALHLKKLQTAVIQENALVGFAFDGDADRVIAVNRAGEVRDGDDLIALLTTHPYYRDQNSYIATIMSNKGLERFLQDRNKTLVRTPVGDRHVTETLIKQSLLLGGEISGHIILTDYLPAGDGIFAALRCLEAMLLTNNLDMITFDHYPQITRKIPVTIKKDLAIDPYRSIIDAHTKMLEDGRIIVRYSGTEPVLRLMVEDCTQTQSEQIAQSLDKALTAAL